MLKIILFTVITCLSLNSFAQNKMKKLDELIISNDSAWPLVQNWIKTAKNKVEVLEVDTAKANKALYESQYSTYSTLGAVIHNSGGILIDNGWVRILGSGNPKLNRSITDWNLGKTIKNYGEEPGYILVADDAVGGFFAINYGALGDDLKNIYYLEPNSLKWQPLGAGYGEFLLFCFDSDLNQFYNGLRWKSWNQFIQNLDGNKTYSFKPQLWENNPFDIEKSSRKIVNIEDAYQLAMDEKSKLKLK